MPGTRPAVRMRRLAPVPRVSRLRALISIFIVLLLFYEQRAHRVLGEDSQNRFGEQPRDRELPDLGAVARIFLKRDRVGHDELIEVRTLDALDRAAGEHGMRAIRDHFARAFLL